MQNIYEEYALLEIKEKEFKLKKDQLRTVILKGMVESGETKKETAMGSFSVSKLKKWSYPEHVNELEENFKVAKAKAESSNEATFTEKESLRFTSIKL